MVGRGISVGVRRIGARTVDEVELADLIPSTEVGRQDAHEAGRMLTAGPGAFHLQDLPVCFPGRGCVDVPPGGAQAMHLIAGLTPVSPAIAAALWAGIGVALVLLGSGVRRRWRGHGPHPCPMVLAIAIALVLGGIVLAWLMHGWLGEAALVYGGGDGRPAAPMPSRVVGSWPLVQAAARTGIALGAVALLLVAITSAVGRPRTVRTHTAPRS